MSKGDFCNVDSFEPSYRTELAIKEMNRIIDMSSLLSTIITFVPLFQIFAGRATYAHASVANTGYQASTYDWKIFEGALSGIGEIKRKRILLIAMDARRYTTGEEAKFWRCVANAL